MLERFIYFKEEIISLIEEASKLPNNKKQSYKVDRLNVTEEEWRFLDIIKSILEIFRKPTIKFQASNYSNSFLIIPYINKLIIELEEFTL
jgi:hypothetical protein